jgi:hypothetical protein
MNTTTLAPNTITVYHTAFADRPDAVGVRTITSEEIGDADWTTGAEVFAERAFMLTNHPSPPEFEQTTEGRCYSTSVGDLIGITNAGEVTTWYLTLSHGFRFLGSGRLGQLMIGSLLSQWKAALAKDPSSWEARRFWDDLSSR